MAEFFLTLSNGFSEVSLSEIKGLLVVIATILSIILNFLVIREKWKNSTELKKMSTNLCL